MALEINDKEQSRQSGFTGWFGMAFATLVGAFILLCAVFGIWTYLNPPTSSYTIKSNHVNSDLILSGKDGAYFVSLPMQQIQLVESTTPVRLLEVQIAFAVEFSADKNEIAAKLPLIQDTLISYLRTATLNELQETSRLFYIKEAILERMNNMLFPTQIKDVLFQKIVVKEVL